MANSGQILGGAASGAGAGMAIGGPYGAAIGAVGGGLLGAFQDSPTDPSQFMQQAADQYNNINSPDLVNAAKALKYQQYLSGGTYTPAMLQRLGVEDSQVNQINESPEAKQKQQVALNSYQQLMNNGLGGAQGQLDLAKVRQMSGQEAQAQNASTMQRFQQMGQGAGAGASLAAQLANNQNSTQNQYMQNLQASANAAQARNQAIGQYAGLASGMRSQDYNTLAANTSAQNQARMFDIANSTQRQQANVNSTNMGNMANLNRAWQQQDQNTNLYNNQQNLAYNAQQQQFNNQLQLASGRANAYAGQANVAQNQNAAQAQNFSNITGGITQAAGAYGQYQNNQDQLAAYNNRTNAIQGNQQSTALNNMQGFGTLPANNSSSDFSYT